MSVFICPNCKEKIVEEKHCFKCRQGHCFDKSKQGYVNLMLSQKSSKKRHGDDSLMIKARADFLSGGYYQPLLDSLKAAALENISNAGVLLDAGCGEGYYTSGIQNHLLENGIYCDTYGTDISKEALKYAAKRSGDISLAVASVASMPVTPLSVDIGLSIFAPYCDTEFYRILKKSGTLIRVIPLEKHLFSLKAAIYDTPYENVPDMPSLFGFMLCEQRDLKYSFTIEGEQLQNLFKMTPYYYKTSAENQKKFKELKKLDTEAAFRILIYKKI